ncbi:MAG TPA: STAS domain-containing protein [Candidatus Koribacter sp.]
MQLNIQSKRVQPDIAILEMTGRITMGNDSLQIEWNSKQLIAENHKKLIFDMTKVSHVDSTGVGIIVMVAGRMKEVGGELRLAGCNEHVAKVLLLTSIDKIVGLYPTPEVAAKSF